MARDRGRRAARRRDRAAAEWTGSVAGMNDLEGGVQWPLCNHEGRMVTTVREGMPARRTLMRPAETKGGYREGRSRGMIEAACVWD